MKKQTETPVLQISEKVIPALLDSIRQTREEKEGISDASILREFYTKLSKWQGTLDTLLWNGADVKQMVETAGEYWNSSLTLHDEHYAILARTGGREGIFPLEYNRTIGMEVYSSATVSEWMDDPEFLQSMGTVGAQWWPIRDRRSLYRNLWNRSGVWCGRIILHPGKTEFTEADRELLECFGHYLEAALEGQNTAHEKVNQLLSKMMQSAIDEKGARMEGVEEILELCGWEEKEEYLCLVLKPTTYEAYSHMRREALTCSTVEDQVADSRAIRIGENIAVIVNLSRAKKSIDEIRSSLAYVIRENVLQMGISQKIREFGLLPMAYRQALTAIDLGWRESQQENGRDALPANSSWSYDFKRYRLAYLLECLEKDDLARAMESKTIQTLKAYDEETGAELAKTLEVYLQQERSIKQTAAYFGINRTTVTYRLSRIEELTQVDLEEAEQRLLLLLLFRLEEARE